MPEVWVSWGGFRYNRKYESTVEDDRVKIFCDFKIQTNHVIQHRRPDIAALYQIERKYHLIDVAVSGDKRVELKEQEKAGNHSNLRQKIKKIWDLSQVAVVPVVIGALAVTSKRLKYWLRKFIELWQKAALLGTAKILM